MLGQNYKDLYPDNYIHPTAIVFPNVKMGKGNYIGAYCIIGDVPESVKYFDRDDFGVVIGDNCRFTKQVTIDAGTESATVIGDNVLMLKNAHVGHDCVVKNYSELRCNAVLGGHCELGEGSKLMLGAIVHPRVKVPHMVIIGANSFVGKRQELEPESTYVGSPVRKLDK